MQTAQTRRELRRKTKADMKKPRVKKKSCANRKSKGNNKKLKRNQSPPKTKTKSSDNPTKGEKISDRDDNAEP